MNSIILTKPQIRRVIEEGHSDLLVPISKICSFNFTDENDFTESFHKYLNILKIKFGTKNDYSFLYEIFKSSVNISFESFKDKYPTIEKEVCIIVKDKEAILKNSNNNEDLVKLISVFVVLCDIYKLLGYNVEIESTKNRREQKESLNNKKLLLIVLSIITFLTTIALIVFFSHTSVKTNTPLREIKKDNVTDNDTHANNKPK